LFGRGDDERAYDAVKLVHSEDLHEWDRFPRCQEFEGITYGQYRTGAYELERRRRTVANLVNAIRELDKIDTDQIVEYQSEVIEVPRRALLRRSVRVPLPEAPRPGASVETSAGSIEEGSVEVCRRWRRQWVQLTYRDASRRVNAERIEELKHRLEAMSDQQRRTIEEVTTSRYAHPVLFVSHRWENEAHPDPTGSQLRKLRRLKDCFIIYDYTSFPQLPRSDQEDADFKQILGSMDDFVRRVIVLEGPDYLTRGWCVYEYIVASLRSSTVCDEVQDGRFVGLRDWASTVPPVTLSFRDSFESQQQNFINERILAAVDDLLQIYGEARFKNDYDRDVVTALLIDHLKETLPSIKESQQGGEWKTTFWSDDKLAPIFSGEGKRPRLEAGIGIRPFDTAVPSTLQVAVNCRYEIKRPDLLALLNPWDSLYRLSSAASETDA